MERAELEAFQMVHNFGFSEAKERVTNRISIIDGVMAKEGYQKRFIKRLEYLGSLETEINKLSNYAKRNKRSN